MTTYTAPGGKILVVLDPQQTISPGGIILPDNAQERSVTGIVSSVGPDVREDLIEGDQVILSSGYAGAVVKDGAHSSVLVAVDEAEILARFAGPEDPWRVVESAVN